MKINNFKFCIRIISFIQTTDDQTKWEKCWNVSGKVNPAAQKSSSSINEPTDEYLNLIKSKIKS